MEELGDIADAAYEADASAVPDEAEPSADEEDEEHWRRFLTSYWWWGWH